MEEGDAASAARILEGAAALGEDRDILGAMGKAYQSAGNPALAEDAEFKRKKLLDSRLW